MNKAHKHGSFLSAHGCDEVRQWERLVADLRSQLEAAQRGQDAAWKAHDEALAERIAERTKREEADQRFAEAERRLGEALRMAEHAATRHQCSQAYTVLAEHAPRRAGVGPDISTKQEADL